MRKRMPFGADYSPNRTVFRLWAPQAVKVLIQRFATGSDEEPGAKFLGEIAMQTQGDGVFYHTIHGDLKNQYYQYQVTDCSGAETWSADPWALAAGVNGKRSMVVNLENTDPPGWNKDQGPRRRKSVPVIWETHVRDFSSDPRSGVSERCRGKYLAFTEENTTLDGQGEVPTCLSYLKELGVTHVQLQPIFDFCTVDERNPQMVYNWGYDPENFNVPEGSFSSDPFHGEVRIRECKAMIQALHRAGIGVIMDVVYNHTFVWDSWFQRTAPGSYYRYLSDGGFANGSGCGTETASDRPVFRQYMVESVCYWAQEYHIDGFRFDLMAVHDVETMNLIRERLDELPGGKAILMYGEPWSALPPQMKNGAVSANKDAMGLLDRRIGAFSDDTRNILMGSPFDVRQSGYASGAATEHLKAQLMGAVHGWCDQERGGYVQSPQQIVQYVSCHDNFTLWDRLVVQGGSQDFHEKNDGLVQKNRLASGIYLTLPGLGFFQSGEEFGRTKQGNGNSYTGPESLNRLDWGRMAWFSDLVDWYRGLIALRRELYPKSMTAEQAVDIPFLEAPGPCVGFLIQSSRRWGQVAVFYNPQNQEQAAALPPGQWRLLCDGVNSRLWQEKSRTVYRTSINLLPYSVTVLGKLR